MSDDEFEFSGPDRGSALTRSRSFIAHTEILHSATSNAYHINKETILQDLAEKQFPLEDSELIFKSFEEAEDDTHHAASYYDGCPISRLMPDAWSPTISIVFMPGLDKMKVNQAEQQGMTQEEPKQKSPKWRVLTAGTFLADLEFDDNLTLKRVDCTPRVVSDIRRRGAPGTTESNGSTALFRVAREDRIVTIDSNNVEIVNNLKPGSTILEATLIEVDKGSLFNLVIDFHRIVRDGGSALNTDTDSRVKLLEVMIEDAQRLAIRSPILFRMSTRQQIARSRNTRYGVDHGSMFETITTSVGIKNIVSKSAACFNSLATIGERNDDQALIRPQFLQMLVLLLSLLNDADLGDIAPFLEKTYRIKADRANIEILILKILPLQSINKSIFVREMVQAVAAHSQRMPDDEEKIWNDFICQLLNNGYILPGYTEQMGQFDSSWLTKFPDGEGFKDSYVFNNLQYCDEFSTINEIPSIDLGMNQKTGEVTSVLTNGNKYLIDVADHRKITGMVYGNYSITAAVGQKRTYDLTISEAFVNDFLNIAIQKTNHLLGIVNSYFATIKMRKKLVKAITHRLEDFNLASTKQRTSRVQDIASCGRLTTHEAKLDGDVLAVAYKVEGKKIARRDLIRNLASDLRKVRSTLHYITTEIQRRDVRRINAETKQTIDSLQSALPEIYQLLTWAEKNKKALEDANLDIGDEPIVQTMFPGSVVHKGSMHWSQYKMRLASNRLRVEAHRRQVRSVGWISEEIVEVYLVDNGVARDRGMQFHVSPLKRVPAEDRQWEIRVDDIVLMIGQYIVIVQDEEGGQHEMPTEPPEPQRLDSRGPFVLSNPGAANGYYGNGQANGPSIPRRPINARPSPQIFMNWMKVVGVQQGKIDPRLRNRQPRNTMVESVVH